MLLNTPMQTTSFPLEYHVERGGTDGATISIRVDAGGNSAEDYLCLPVINGINVAKYPLHRGSYTMTAPSHIATLSFIVKKNSSTWRGTGIMMGYNDVMTDTICLHSADLKCMRVTINIIDSLFGYKVFKDEALMLKRRSLQFKAKGKNYCLRYVKPSQLRLRVKTAHSKNK
jgi:hypothetical protein